MKLTFFLFLCFTGFVFSDSPPNIVFIFADDMGYGDVQVLNPERGKIPTPNMDQLARDGMVFTDAHTTSSVCTPSRYSLLTGRYNWRTQLQQGVLWGYSEALIDDERLTVPALLGKQGYETACIGKWHLGMRLPTVDNGPLPVGRSPKSLNIDWTGKITDGPTERGFDYFYGISASLDMAPYAYIENDRFTTKVIESKRSATGEGFVRSEVLPETGRRSADYIRTRDGSAPYFLYVPLTSPHTPIVPTEEWLGKSGLGKYGDFQMQTDHVIGEIIKAVDESGQRDNTLVIVSSDNGCSKAAGFSKLNQQGHFPSAQYRGSKADIWEGGHRVPFIARWPAAVKPGSTSDATICTTDLIATCAELTDAKLAADAGVDSVSFLPALKGQAIVSERAGIVHHSISGHFAYRKGPWKLLLARGSGGWTSPVEKQAVNDPDGQLYNLDDDPGETTNLYLTHPEQTARLLAQLTEDVERGRSTPGPDQANDVEQIKLWKNGKPAVPAPGQKADNAPHAVIVVGTHHYSPQKTMPGFAAELERLGFRTTLINPSYDPEKDKRGLPGIEALDDADVALFFMRFLKLSDKQLAPITRYVESGKPVVGLRTSTHAFRYPNGDPRHKWNNGFGRDVLGTPYQIHLNSSTRLQFAKGAGKHPILTGVQAGADWTSPGTLYLTDLQPGVQALILGTGHPKAKVPTVRKNGFGTHKLTPEMTDTVAWTWENKWGGRTFTSSLGHVGDFSQADSLRVMINGMFWAAGEPVPAADAKINPIQITAAKNGPAKKSTAVKAPKAKPAPAAKPQANAKPQASATPQAKAGAENQAPLTIIYGNSFVERFQEDGTFEALLHAAEPDRPKRIRSFAYTGDEVGFRIRPAKFGKHLGFIAGQLPCERVLMCFGMNEAFAGEAGLATFEADLQLYLSIIGQRHPGAELILVSPTAIEANEATDAGAFPDPAVRNPQIQAYVSMMGQIATKAGVRFIDLYAPSLELFDQADAPLTLNGLHLNQTGNRAVGTRLAGEMTSPKAVAAVDTAASGFARLRELVARKAYEFAMAYKPTNGIHYYGLRARDYEFSAEIPHHLHLARELDKVIWQQAEGIATAVPFPELETKQAVAPNRAPRRGLGKIKTTEEDLADFTLAEGFEVNAFASSEDFPELINPLQIQFDARGRCWVTCFASYPVPVPGTLSDDKILIFEDTDRDGKADKRTVFAEGLKLPDGFVLYRDGIVVSIARKLIWLRDTDGDDQADTQEELLRGADDTDTHHGGNLSRTPQGDIILNEALFHRGQFETPHGPLRTKNATALYFNPASQALRIQRQTTHPNPWKITWNRKGEAIQMFGGGQIIDGDLYDVATPIGTASSASMGMPFRDAKGCSIAFVTGSHFPEEWRGSLVTGHLLGKNTVHYTPIATEQGTYVKQGDPTVLLNSSNASFRPVDMEFGLDGALYVSDFYYPIIGHAQHSIRDKNRDYSNGRIWRLTRKDAPLSTPPTIAGEPVEALFNLLTHDHVRVRQLARIELEKHPSDKVLAAVRSQVKRAGEDHALGLELLWQLERLQAYDDPSLFLKLAGSDDLVIRRAAIKSLPMWSDVLGPEAKVLATNLAKTDDARSQISLVSAASYLAASDPFWGDLIQSVDAPSGSPVDRMKQLAALADTPPISREFPLLDVAADCNITDWLPSSSHAKGGTLCLNADRAQPVILGYTGNAYMNINVNGIPLLRATGSQHSRDGQLSADLVAGPNLIEYFIEMDGKSKSGPVQIYLANLIGQLPTDVTFPANTKQHETWTKAWNDQNAVVTDTRITLKAVPSQMAYNAKRIKVKAGQTYTLIFENPDHMPHNLVITTPGKGQEVGALADAMAAQPDAFAKHYIPETNDILLATPQIPHGKTTRHTFTAPKKTGKYPYICTFPGHWRMMKGVMVVEAK